MSPMTDTPHQHEDAERQETPIGRLCRKLDELKDDITCLRRDLIGDDAESVSKSVLTRVAGLEARTKTIEDRLDKGQSRMSRIVDNVAGQLLIAIIVFVAGTMVWLKSMPPDAAARLHSIQTPTK